MIACIFVLFISLSESFHSTFPFKNTILNRVNVDMDRYSTQQVVLHSVNKRDKQFDKIFDQIDFKRGQTEELPPMEQDPLYPVVKAIVVAGSSRKAGGITALRVTHLTEVTRFMVVLEGNSRPQTQAIANAVEVHNYKSII